MGTTFIIGIFHVNVYPDLQIVRQKAPSQTPNPDIEKNNSALLSFGPLPHIEEHL